MNGLVDGYISKYESEETSFKEASDAMDQVIKDAADAEAKQRAVDEKAKLKKEHENTLKDLAGFIRTMDETIKALRPGEKKDWKDDFPDLKTKVDEIFTAYPAFIEVEGSRKRVRALRTLAH